MYPIVFTQEKRDEQQKPVYQQQRNAPNRLLWLQINRLPEKKLHPDDGAFLCINEVES